MSHPLVYTFLAYREARRQERIDHMLLFSAAMLAISSPAVALAAWWLQ